MQFECADWWLQDLYRWTVYIGVPTTLYPISRYICCSCNDGNDKGLLGLCDRHFAGTMWIICTRWYRRGGLKLSTHDATDRTRTSYSNNCHSCDTAEENWANEIATRERREHFRSANWCYIVWLSYACYFFSDSMYYILGVLDVFSFKIQRGNGWRKP